MIFYCDPHATTHSLTPEQTERVVYAMSCEIADANCEPDGDRINAGDDALDHIPCVLDFLGLSNSPEGYLELVDPWVGFRRDLTPQQPVQPSTEAVDTGARALAAWLKLDFDSIEPDSQGILRGQVTAILAAAAPLLGAAERDLQLARELYTAFYPGTAWPDRPADTVWNHLLNQIRAQDVRQRGLRTEVERLRKALEELDQVARVRAALGELGPTDAANTVRGLEELLKDYDQQQLIEATSHEDDA